MNVNLAQIITHAVGFLIAMWLVKKFAWEKLQGFMEHRRETIARSFADIAQGREEVAAEKKRYADELERIEDVRRARIQDAAREADKLAGEIREEARQQTVAMRQKAKQDVELEIDKANVALRNRMVEAVIATTERILKERLDAERHARLIDEFLDEVESGRAASESGGKAA